MQRLTPQGSRRRAAAIAAGSAGIVVAQGWLSTEAPGPAAT
jgi:hypothetical protein